MILPSYRSDEGINQPESTSQVDELWLIHLFLCRKTFRKDALSIEIRKKHICVYNMGYAQKRQERGIENSVLNIRITS